MSEQEKLESAVHYDNEDMNKAAYYMSSEGGRDWKKGAEYADKACVTGERLPYIASIFCHRRIALELMEEGDPFAASYEWDTVIDRIIKCRVDLSAGRFQLKDSDQTFVNMAQNDALYGMALSMYVGLTAREDTQDKDSIINTMVEGLLEVKESRAELLLGLAYDMQNKRKQAAKLLRRVLETSDYAEKEKTTYEEVAYFHGVICLASYYGNGIPNYISKNIDEAVATLEHGIEGVTRDDLREALLSEREKYKGQPNATQSNQLMQQSRSTAPREEEFVMGNGVVYSRSRMKESVDMCSRKLGLQKMIRDAKHSLSIQYPTDEEYIRNASNTTWHYIKMFFAGLFGTSVVLGILALIIRAIFRYKVTSGIMALDWIIEILGGVVAVYMSWTSKDQIMASDAFQKMKEERDWRDTHISQIKDLISESETELSALEQTMSDRNKCIIPQTYWGVAGYLWSYIGNGRANNLTEAINLHEDLEHKARVNGILTDIFETAQKAQQYAEDAGYEAVQARMASERAASYADDARFWSMLNYFSNR